jgi:SAM-dependent methyltransferase
MGAPARAPGPSPDLAGLAWLCPHCRGPLSRQGDSLRCPGDGFESLPLEGLRDFLTPEERARHAAFLRHYQGVRRQEGRGSDSPRHYLGLPQRGPGREWRLRARGLRWLAESLAAAPGVALDAGAGCCWLSRHLAEWGWAPVALDLTDDDRDGLRAGRHYLERLGLRFERVLASFERLPFAAGSFDLVVFNASFHYAANPEAVLAEAARVARPGAPIVLLDSPLFRDPASGRRMSQERGGAGFLTDSGLDRLAARLGLELLSERPHPSALGRWRQARVERRLGRETAAMSRVVLRSERPPRS